MPNEANESKHSKSTNHQGQPKDRPESNSDAPKPNPERSDVKYGSHNEQDGHPGDTSRSSSQGRKEASGGSAAD